MVGKSSCASPFGPELGTPDDRVDQGFETILVGGELAAHFLERRLVGEDQAAAERIREQLAAEIVDEVLLSMVADVGAEAVEAVTLAAAGELGLSVDCAAGEVDRALLADWAIAFEHEAEGIE